MLEQLIPNVMVKIPKLIQSILETFQMMGWSGSDLVCTRAVLRRCADRYPQGRHHGMSSGLLGS